MSAQRILKIGLYSFLCNIMILSVAMSEAPESSSSHVVSKGKQSAAQSLHTYSTGIFYGRLHSIHPEQVFLEVSTAEVPKGKRTFFLDRHTKYDLDGVSAKVSILQPGQKVAVRFFAQDSFTMADEVYVVSGNYLPENYTGVRKRRKH